MLRTKLRGASAARRGVVIGVLVLGVFLVLSAGKNAVLGDPILTSTSVLAAAAAGLFFGLADAGLSLLVRRQRASANEGAGDRGEDVF